MARVRVFCMLLFVLPTFNGYPACQNWCYGQRQPMVTGNNWGNICRPNTYIQSSCNYNPGYAQQGYRGGNIGTYPVAPVIVNSGYPTYPGYTNYPISSGQVQQPIYLVQNPASVNIAPIRIPIPAPLPVPLPLPVPSQQQPINLITETQSGYTHKEWICPADPEPRVLHIGLKECDYDENCPTPNPNFPIKCCHDQGINRKVCKPAIPR